MEFAAVFPGQGAQKVGMLSAYARKYGEIKEYFGQASDLLSVDLLRLATRGPEEELNLTVNTQPILLTASYALWKIWCRVTDLRPTILVGHSLGEYSALTCSGVLKFTDAVLLVRRRAELMQEASPLGESAMAAVIGVEAAVVKIICKEISGGGKIVEPANYNSLKQTVIAGDKELVDEFAQHFKDKASVRVVPLAVSAPAHTTLMDKMAAEFSRYLSKVKFHAAEIPVVMNVNAEITKSRTKIMAGLKKQIRQPVLWHESVKSVSDLGVENFVEIGPGRVLSGLLGRIDRDFFAHSIETPDGLKNILEIMET